MIKRRWETDLKVKALGEFLISITYDSQSLGLKLVASYK